MACPFVGAN
ncbi:hypothetical protein GBAR_LOCUS8007 [Geodia barretti]|uniref:Uncharacterized protein n=1 Tax=Geodia barretti TaxID=519541 RepID=A0AA35RJ47_GEOBA|nr:hypothetical protein GBAR_LOCUS8007 [Geodia barretti]